MARTRPPDRLSSLVAAATPLFVRAGVRRVQMDEIARAVGVAKGTLYLYVESKEALFDACLRQARPGAPALPETLPLPDPDEGSTLAFVQQVAREESVLPWLDQPSTGDRAEVDTMLADLYRMLERNGTLLRLVAGSAVDWPELGGLWYRETRDPVVGRLGRWIVAREPLLRPGLDPSATARLVAETATWFAVHRRWDPRPGELDDDLARTTALSALHHVLLEDRCPRP